MSIDTYKYVATARWVWYLYARCLRTASSTIKPAQPPTSGRRTKNSPPRRQVKRYSNLGSPPRHELHKWVWVSKGVQHSQQLTIRSCLLHSLSTESNHDPLWTALCIPTQKRERTHKVPLDPSFPRLPKASKDLQEPQSIGHWA